MSVLVDWLRDRRARAVVTEAEDVVAMVSIKTGAVYLYPGHGGIEAGESDSREASGHTGAPCVASTSPASTIRPRQCINRWCRGWFFDRSDNDQCACCRAMPEGPP